MKAVNILGEIKDLDASLSKNGWLSQSDQLSLLENIGPGRAGRTNGTSTTIGLSSRTGQSSARNWIKAIDLYEQAFEIWAEIFDDYPILTVDDTAEDLYKSIRRYMVLIDSEELPEDFPLTAFVEMMGDQGEVTQTDTWN